ncbi:diguanylate cyclase [Arcobacter sp. s6]|uniref:diguanylate cyclase n=1 Tax=Arcobacter sp. s6 TaxID=3230363 RepID=UPI00349FE883
MIQKIKLYYYLFSISILILFCIDNYVSYTHEKTLTLNRTSNSSLLISEWIKSAFISSDYILQDMIYTVPSSELQYPAKNIDSYRKITKYINDKRKTLPNANGVGLNDKNCILTHTPAIVGFNAIDREWCSVPKNNPKIQTYISNMFESNIGELMVVQVRKFPGETFTGLAGLGVNLNFFSKWLEKVKTTPHGMIAIVDSKMNLLARQPALDNMLGKEIDNSIIKDFIASNTTQSLYSGKNIVLDKENSIYSLRKVDNSPFVVIVGEADEDWQERWRKQVVVSILILITLWIMAWQILQHYIQTLENEKKLEHLSQTDQLTGLYNRHKLHQVFTSEINRSNRFEEVFGVILLDLDLFKNVNDTYGHDVGDLVLKEISNILKDNIRASDTLGRWGGEEFLIILPKIDIDGAKILAEKLRKEIENHQFTIAGKMTASFGLAYYKKGDDENSIIKRADDALYKAKEIGRNIVKIEE